MGLKRPQYTVRVLAEKHGHTTRNDVVAVHPGESLDHLCKRIGGLTTFQAYTLKVKGEVIVEDNGWKVTVTLSTSPSPMG